MEEPDSLLKRGPTELKNNVEMTQGASATELQRALDAGNIDSALQSRPILQTRALLHSDLDDDDSESTSGGYSGSGGNSASGSGSGGGEAALHDVMATGGAGGGVGGHSTHGHVRSSSSSSLGVAGSSKSDPSPARRGTFVSSRLPMFVQRAEVPAQLAPSELLQRRYSFFFFCTIDSN